MAQSLEYQPQTAAETLHHIADGMDPWLAMGQFLDDWRRTEPAERPWLCHEPLPSVTAQHLKWAALLAASVEWLCSQSELPFPAWSGRAEYRLAEPWFLYPGWRLRAWQLMETPAPFKLRNIFGGDRILARV
jgi:hypothetical protein